jgi:hypothetical protein
MRTDDSVSILTHAAAVSQSAPDCRKPLRRFLRSIRPQPDAGQAGGHACTHQAPATRPPQLPTAAEHPSRLSCGYPLEQESQSVSQSAPDCRKPLRRFLRSIRPHPHAGQAGGHGACKKTVSPSFCTRKSRAWRRAKRYIITIADDDRRILDKLCQRLIAADATCDVLRNPIRQD